MLHLCYHVQEGQAPLPLPSLRKGTLDRARHSPRPATSQQLGFRQGLPDHLRTPGTPSLCGRVPLLVRGQEPR